MRSKEDAHDYRYFPDPDLLPLEFNDELLKMLKKKYLSYQTKKNRFIENLN